MQWCSPNTPTPPSSCYLADEKYVASGDSNRNIMVFEVDGGKKVMGPRWKFHTAKVTSLAWTSDSKKLASGSLDTNIYIWNMDKEMKKIAIKGKLSPFICPVVGLSTTREFDISFRDTY